MQKSKKLLMVSALATLTSSALLLFNNCGEVKFSPTEDSMVRALEQNTDISEENFSDTNASDPANNTSDVTNTTTTTITDVGTIDTLVNNLPTDVAEAPRPVTDLIDNPTLISNYPCPDGNGVVICHFPENVDAQATQCVGAAAVETHYDHIRNYQKDGQALTVQDYLGPCRVSL